MENPIVREINDDPKLRNAIVEACEKAGRPLSPQAIHAWKNLRNGVPPDRVAIVARVLKRKPYEIRPDVFPPPLSKRRPS